MLRSALEDAGLANAVELNSCGLGGWHVGDGADRRAIAQLAQDGYDGTKHRAAQFGPAHADADIFLAMDHGHVNGLIDNGVDPEKVYLKRTWVVSTIGVDSGVAPRGQRSSVSTARKVLEK